MSFIGGIIKIGAAAGVAYSLKKISDKYKANKPSEYATRAEKSEAYKQAAREYYNETADLIREKAPGVKENFNAKVQQAADFANEKLPAVTEKIQCGVEKAASFAEDKMPGVSAKVLEVVDTVAEKVAGFVEGQPAASAEDDFSAVVDAAEEPDIEVTFEEVVEEAENLADELKSKEQE